VWLAIALLLALLRREVWVLVAVALADGVAQLAARGLKSATGIERPPLRYARPEPLLHVPGDPSFPSGHAASSFACALVLAWFAPRLAVPLFLLAAGIAFSRVYVGAHWPLDVVGGAMLGLAVATALRLLAGALRRSPRAPRAG
jgi:undecaprenyl-diphosphatase